MKSVLPTTIAVLTVLCATTFAGAAMIGGQNWADQVEAYTANIQNYNATLMDGSTTWWLTGSPDADATHDYVGGWRGGSANEYIVMKWDTPLADTPGDDLVIRLFGGSTASADVLASVDGTTFTSIGSLGGGTPQVFQLETFDFDGQFAGDVSYVKVQRTAKGPGTGMFFDAFGSTPEPGTAVLLLVGLATLAMRRRRA